MRINDGSSIQNLFLTQGNPGRQQTPSVFGNDQVQTGEIKPKFCITQKQINSLFEKKDKSNQTTPANWETTIDGFVDSDHGCLFSSDGSFYSMKNDKFCKFDGKTRDIKWAINLTSPFIATNEPLVEGKDGTVLAGCRDNKIKAFDPTNGDEKWNIDLGAKFDTPVKVLNNGDIAVMRKIDDHLCFTRLSPDGKEKNTIQLGLWDEPTNRAKTVFINEESNGDFLVQGSVLKDKNDGTSQVSTEEITFCIAPDDKIKWTISGFEPPFSFSDNPDRLYRQNYESLLCFDKSSGQEVWRQEKSQIPGTNFSEAFFTIAGEQKYTFAQFLDSRNGKLILQCHAQDPIGNTKLTEEIICVDQDDLNKVYWKKDTAGTIFKGPILVDKDTILHINDEEAGTIEALDPATGNSKWTASLNEQFLMPDGKTEKPDIKKAIKADDGSIFVMTKHGVYGLDGQNGQIISTAISPGELTQFQVDTNSKTIIAVDDENYTVRQFNISTIDEQKDETAKKETEQAAAQESEAPTIQETEKEVIIGGISLKKARK